MANKISVSFHIGSKNNAIPNLKKLKTIDIHNNRKYSKSNNEDLDLSKSKYNIILKGTKNLVADVKKLYKTEFDEAVYSYNQKQTRENRKITNYLTKVEEDKQKNIATEIILQLGDKQDWKDIDLEDKEKMKNVFEKGLETLESKGFKVANAVLHLDETSPHCHIIGVPIGTNFKKGMEKQVSSKSVFSLDKMEVLRDEIEKVLIAEYNKVYDLSVEKKQEKGLIEEHLSITEYKQIKPIVNELIKVTDKNIILEEIKENLKDKEKEIKEVKESIDYNNTLKEKLVGETEAKEKEIAELKAILKEKDDIKEQFYKNDSYIFDLKNKTDEQKKEIEAKEKTLKDLEIENKKIQDDINKEWDIRNSIKDKELKISELKLEYAEKTTEFEKVEKKAKEQDDFLLEYRIKISNFNNDKEELEEKIKVAEKEKEEEEKKLDSKKKELAEIIANRKNIDFDLSEEKRKEEEKKKNNERINKLNAELEEQKERIKKLIEQEEAYNVNGFKISTPEKKFVEEAFEKGVEKVYIMAKPDEFYAIYLDKNGDEIKMNNEIFYNDADKYYNSVYDIAKHTRFSYNFKTGETLLETKSEDIEFKSSGIFNFVRTLNSPNIDEIMKHNYNIAKGIEDDKEEREIEKEYKETEKEVVKKKDEDEKDYHEY
ncbi:plasmid recombination protein [Fusobacterium polymorphum]|uniref:plasmid recombination protein n=1 Tax=Fusobacterium nucleatum subsp. polymorphum TaxID=76857 RepID=UPI00300B273C